MTSIRQSSNMGGSNEEKLVSEIGEASLSRRRYSVQQTITCDFDFLSDPSVAKINLLNLSSEILTKIFSYLDYNTIAYLRPVSRRINRVCGSILNFTFKKLQIQIKRCYKAIKVQMPKRPSARYNHPLARELDIISTLSTDFNSLQRQFHKYIERNHSCFFPGKILDEGYRILHYVKATPNIPESSEEFCEFNDLSFMAMEYFELHIASNLSEIPSFSDANKVTSISQSSNIGESDGGESVSEIDEVGLSRRQYSVPQANTCDWVFMFDPPVFNLKLLDLPFEILTKIFSYLDYNTIAHLRPVSRQMNRVCGAVLNSAFKKFQVQIKRCYQVITVQMPRRPSQRLDHPLYCKFSTINYFHLRNMFMQEIFSKYIERKNCCFFPGKILDEGYRVLHYVKATPNIPESSEEVCEFNDLSFMAMEYFELYIAPNLPEKLSFSDGKKIKSIRQSSNIGESDGGESVSEIDEVGLSRKQYSVPQANTRDWDFMFDPPVFNLKLLDLPFEILTKIFSYLDYNTIAYLRPVSRQMNRVCGAVLNSTFKKLQVQVKRCYQAITAQMPRRPSVRCDHPLAPELDIISTLSMDLNSFHRQFHKYIERNHGCFFPGKILDEVYRILHDIKIILKLSLSEEASNFSYRDAMRELEDLCTMAKEYFDLHIESSFS